MNRTVWYNQLREIVHHEGCTQKEAETAFMITGSIEKSRRAITLSYDGNIEAVEKFALLEIDQTYEEYQAWQRFIIDNPSWGNIPMYHVMDTMFFSAYKARYFWKKLVYEIKTESVVGKLYVKLKRLL